MYVVLKYNNDWNHTATGSCSCGNVAKLLDINDKNISGTWLTVIYMSFYADIICFKVDNWVWRLKFMTLFQGGLHIRIWLILIITNSENII